jgi:AcrR family transcriptional regulator
MNSKKSTYDNSKRQVDAEKTKIKILNAFGDLWSEYSIRDITLEMVAKEAGLTTKTILRKFGSKEGLTNESLSYLAAKIESERTSTNAGQVDEILKALLSNYEKMGEAAIRTINLESELEIARQIGAKGRKLHRDWCMRMFASFLPDKQSDDYEIQLVSFIAATEIYLWKLMRKDLELSKEQTFSIFKNLVEGLINKNLR